MFSNPLTPQEILQLAQQSVASGQFGPVLPNAYVFATPPTEFGPPAFRLFDAAYITTGIIDPNRLGTGATGAGNLYLADDGTWKPVSGGGGVGTLDQVTDLGNVTTNTIDVGGVKSDYFLLDTTATPTLQPGMFGWNDAYGTADLRLKGNNVTLQLGQEILARVVNKTGADLLESQYKVVRVRIASEGGAQGQRLAVVLAQGDNDPDSATTLGIVTETIADNQEGFITILGNVNGINTTGSLQGETWVDGDVLYLSPTTPGGLTKVKPTAPDHTVTVGYVVYAHANQGKIFVKVDNGYELDELHNVKITSVANNDLLQYDSTQQVWKNVAASVAIPTPTLDQVTTAGNTTTNAISVGGLVVDTTTLVVDSVNNRVGIGTATPLYGSLHVEGSVYIKNGSFLQSKDGGSTIYDLIGVISGGIVQVGQPNRGLTFRGGGASSDIIFNISGDRMVLKGNTYNLLIGTSTDAGYKLDVNGTARVSGNLTVDTNTLFVDAANDRVGIGTITPSAKVDINLGAGDITNSVYIRNSSSTGYSSVTMFDDRNTTSYIGQWGIYGSGVASPNTSNMFFYNTAGGGIGFYVGTGAVPTNDLRLLIKSSGNVLIGTNTESGHKLRVNGTVSAVLTNATHTSQVYYNTTTGELTYGALPTPATPTLAQVTTAGNTTTNGITIGSLIVDTNVLVVDGTNDKVSIGTASPTYGFEVAGIGGASITAKFASTGSSRNGMYLVGNGTTSNVSGSGIFLGNSEGSLQASLSTHSYHFGTGVLGAVLQSSGTIVLAQGTTERLRVAPTTGNILIGTTTDSGYKLDVNGSIRGRDNLYITSFDENDGIFADDAFGSTMFSISRRSSNEIRFHSYGFTTFYTSGNTGTEKMRITETGNVGIGTTSPSQQLHVTGKVLIGALDNYGDANTKLYVHSPTNSVNIVLNPRPTAGDIYYRVKIGVDVNTNGSFYVDHEGNRIIEAWNSGGYLNLASVVSLGNKAWTLETNGYGLQMYSPYGWSSVVRYTNAATGTTATDGAFTGITENGDFRVWTYENHPMLFATNNLERLRIAADGNVGIGTNSPGYKLQVAGTTRSDKFLVIDTGNNSVFRIGASTSSEGGLYMRSGAPSDGEIAGGVYFVGGFPYAAATGASAINFYAGDTYFTGNSGLTVGASFVPSTRMLLKANGNLLIGTTTDIGYTLNVNGTARVAGNTVVSGNMGIGASAGIIAPTLFVYGAKGSFGTFSDTVAGFKSTGNTYISIDSDSGNDTGVQYVSNGVTNWVLLNSRSLGGFASYSTAFGYTTLIKDNGNFLIGTTTDTGEKLQVNGVVRAAGFSLNGAAGYTGIFTIPGNLPGQQNLDIQGGIIVNVF